MGSNFIFVGRKKIPHEEGNISIGGRGGTRTHNRFTGTDFKSVV